MTDYFVAATGSNTSPYETWAKAATSLATVLALATTDGDRVILDAADMPSTDEEVASSTTYTIGASISIISSSNSGTSTITPTKMGTTTWIGNSTTNRSITFAGAYQVYFYGVTIRIAGSTGSSLNIATTSSDGADYTLDGCYLWQGNSNTTALLSVGVAGTNSNQSSIRLVDCIYRFGSASQGLKINCNTEIIGGSLSSSGTAPTSFFSTPSVNSSNSHCKIYGLDVSAGGTNFVGDFTTASCVYHAYGCKFPASYSLLASQTAKRAGAEVYANDCWSGDEHWHFAHADALGSTTGIAQSESGAIYRTSDGAKYDGTNTISWKIVGTADATFRSPYKSPWIEVYHSGTSSITPYLEILRDGSTTAYNNDEVWAEWLVKTTSGQALSTLYTDRRALAGSAAAQANGSGLGDWSGESGSAWSGKLDTGSAVTPAEVGMMAARVCVTGANTVWVDPTIRGRT